MPLPLNESPLVVPLDGVPAMEATGVAAPALFRNANFALVVALPPSNRS